MKRSLRSLTQVLFLTFFLLLMVLGRPQLWMAVFLSSMVLAFFAGRLYCGYLCPINTLMEPVTWLKRKLKIKDNKLPKFFEYPAVRFFAVLFFLATFGFTMLTGKRLPVLPLLVAVGVGLTLFFPEALWHRYLCPYGLFLSFPSRKAKKRVFVTTEKCINCTKCARVCPSRAIIRVEKHQVLPQECLVCGDCIRACPTDAITFI